MLLLLTDPDRDYLADQLYDGFVSLLGASQVIDWPPKPSLHLSASEPAVFDCDFRHPEHGWTQERIIETVVHGDFDLVVVPTLRGSVLQRLYLYRHALRRVADRLVFVDGEDDQLDRRSILEDALGFGPVACFKRELPLGAHWAEPLPFGYPAERIVPVGRRRTGAFLCAYLWEWAGDGTMRRQLTDLLSGEPGIGVHTAWQPAGRLGLDAYHARNRDAAVAISPAGRGYHTNRHLEIIADGCAPVLERPWVQWPDGPTDGTHAALFGSAEEALDRIRELLAEPERARALAETAQAWLRLHHTTERRAQALWRAVHGSYGRR